MRVAIRELKSRLSHILAQAQAQRGEVVEVTSHNKPIARILGIPAHADTGLRTLAADGGLAWRGSKPDLAPPLPLRGSARLVSALVLEGRG